MGAGRARGRIRALLASLDDEHRVAIELLAVAPGPVPLDVLEHVVTREVAVDLADDGMAELVEERLVVRAEIRGVVVQDLPSSRRAERERALADAWSKIAEPCPESIAVLLHRSGDLTAAAPWYRLAAEAATAGGRIDDAVRHYAVAHRAGALDDPEALTVAACLAASSGKSARAEHWARDAVRLHTERGDVEAAVRVWQQPALAYLRRGMPPVGRLPTDSIVARAVDAEGRARRREPIAAETAAAVVADARTAGDEQSMSTGALALLLAGEAAAAEVVLEELRQRAVDVDDPLAEATHLRALARIAIATGDLQTAVLRARAAVNAADRRPDTTDAAYQRIHLAAVLGLVDRHDEATEVVEPALRDRDGLVAVIAGVALATGDLARGEVDRALVRLAPILPHRASVGPDAFSSVLVLLADAQLQLGDLDRAQGTLRTIDDWVGGTLEPTRPDALLLDARVAARRRDENRLVHLVGVVDDLADHPSAGPGLRAAAHLVRSLHHATAGRFDAAASAAATAAEHATRAPRPRVAAEAWCDAADHAQRVGDPDAVRTALGAAAALTATHDLGVVRARLDTFDDPAARRPLTPREVSLLGLLRAGRTNRQIADQLHLSEKTVRNQLTMLFAKLGIERRTQAAVLAVELGILPPDAPPGAGP